MSGLIIVFFACIGGLVTFFVMFPAMTAILLCKWKGRELRIPVLQALHEYEQQGAASIAEITKALEDSGSFGYILRLHDRFPASKHKYISKILDFFALQHLTADACHMALRAKLIKNVGGILPWDEDQISRSLLPQYQLSDKGYKELSRLART